MSEPTNLSFILRWRLELRLRRAWREGMAERHAGTLDALSAVTGHDPVVASRPSRRGLGAVTEIVFASGAEIRLSSCYRPYVALLAKRATDRVVVLDHAAYHGNCWGLYFAAGDERVPLLAQEITVVGGRGGQLRLPAGLSPLRV